MSSNQPSKAKSAPNYAPPPESRKGSAASPSSATEGRRPSLLSKSGWDAKSAHAPPGTEFVGPPELPPSSVFPQMIGGAPGGSASSYNAPYIAAPPPKGFNAPTYQRTPSSPAAVPEGFNPSVPSVYKPVFSVTSDRAPTVSSSRFQSGTSSEGSGLQAYIEGALCGAEPEDPSQLQLQPYPDGVKPKPEALNEGYERLKLRGMESLRGVSRQVLDQYVMYSQYYYDAILPLKDRSVKQSGYEAHVPLEVNMFPLKINQPEIMRYNLSWRPPNAATKTTLRTWKIKVWKKLSDVATVRWKQTGNFQLKHPEFGIGAWDNGIRLFRSDEIPNTILNDPKTNPVVTDCVVETGSGYHGRFDTKEQRVELTIENNPTRLFTDMSELIKKGCDEHGYESWFHLRSALQNIFYHFPAWRMGWTEDSKRQRMFFPTVYGPKDLNRDAAADAVNAVRGIVFFPEECGEPVNDMFVVRRGYRTTPKLFPSGLCVNVWTCLSPFFRAQVTVDHAIDIVLKLKVNRPFDGVPLRGNELNLLVENLQYIRVYTKLTQKVDEYKDPARFPRRLYKIYGFSQEPCDRLKIPIYQRDARGNINGSLAGSEDFLPFCQKLYRAAFKEWPELDFRNVERRLLTLPAVKVHPRFECYLPPWALVIKEHDKHSVRFKSKFSIAATAMRARRELYQRRGTEDLFTFLTDFMKLWTTTDIALPTFKIQIDPNPMKVTGCRLRPPHEFYCINSDTGKPQVPAISPSGYRLGVAPNRGANLELCHFATIKDYMILHFDESQPEKCYEWVRKLCQLNKIPEQKYPALQKRTPFVYSVGEVGDLPAFTNAIDEAIQSYRRKTQNTQGIPDLIFLFYYRKEFGSDIYDAFKYKCDVELGTRSQAVCLQRWNFRAGAAAYQPYLHMLIKLNKKMGGTNLLLKGPYINQPDLPGTMIFGADVSHPDPVKVHHSIACVVGTVDMPPRTYGARIRVQPANQELIQELQDMVGSLTRAFHRRNPGVALERVFFFRDGVGDEDVPNLLLNKEIPAIFNGLHEGGAGPHVKVVYILAVKRHHTRFRDRANERTQGIQPGTAVNELPVYPLQTSFYLCTHLHPPENARHGLQVGVTKSTLYHVILDQLGLPLPELQTMIYHLCFTYEKSSTTLSVVPPVHYAHIVCTRGRGYYVEALRKNVKIEFPDPKVTVSWGEAYPRHVQTSLDAHKSLKDTMYYI
ncbi:hypothetical protein R1sor_007259 [Riccia sorocarpa]|uniref:Piwi domain-containing protein n=1 Tax=Riccia sorocarpa TaxID=122646 RepID=A0ABD3HQA5_9MARC